ncbi:hypothetical protein JCM8547_007350 [Rhodosporidiobolus lusitaniae]
MPRDAPSSSIAHSRPLTNIKAILFDTFGTLVDWEGSITRLLTEEAKKEQGGKAGELKKTDWLEFTRRWRKGYMVRTREIASGKPGPGNIDDLHLEILNGLLEDPSYSAVASAWSSEKRRKELCQLWHKLDAWPDVKPGLEALRKLDPSILLATLSNGTLRLLIDLAHHSSLTLDAHFSGDFLGSYKPNPKMYLGASSLLGFGSEEARVEKGEVAMCAAHIGDLRAAKEHGLRTIYLRRSTEDVGVEGGGHAVKPASEGGEVDIVLEGEGEGLKELAGLLR